MTNDGDDTKTHKALGLRYDLIPAAPLRKVAEVYTVGSRKYGDNNWRRGGVPLSTWIAAGERHWQAFKSGADYDADGFHHLAAVVFHAFAAMEYLEFGLGPDDRWRAPVDAAAEQPGPAGAASESPRGEAFRAGDRVWVDHPVYGRCRGTINGFDEHNKAYCAVSLDATRGCSLVHEGSLSPLIDEAA